VKLSDLEDLADDLIREEKMRLSLVGPVADEKPFRDLLRAG